MVERKRIAFIVEPMFMQHHVGVRNYIYSLFTLLADDHRVDFISSYRTEAGRDHWYRLIPKHASTISGNGKADDAVIRGTPRQVARRSRLHLGSLKSTSPKDFHHSHIGSDLRIEEIDVAVVTNPWLVNFDKRIPCKKLLGMVYDTVPNEYVFTRDDKPFTFASQHQKGFQYYKDHCDAILAISRKAADDVQSMFKIEASRVHSLPPVLPPAYAEVVSATNQRSRRVVLASPFDRRKGLALMPGILNEAKDHIDQLSIYGGIRCSRKEFVQFFSELNVRSVEWYPNATAKIVQQLFLDSRALLFPSFDEGLGLPILESQFCGCPTMVRNKLPMNDLVGAGHRFVTDDAKVDGKLLAGMMTESFDHKSLQDWALSEFSSQHVLRVIDNIMNDNCAVPFVTELNKLELAA
jgi:glycosyltransferase involved in cell wall biosynthesis